MFIRIKKIKNIEYAYLVENMWSGKGSRQKVKEYIGKVFRPLLGEDVHFSEYGKLEDIGNYLDKVNAKNIFKDLLEWESYRHNLKEFEIDFDKLSVKRKNKNCAIIMNEGCLCSATLQNLLNFVPMNDEHDSFRLAKALVDAGIKVPQDIFIGLCEKMFKFE